MGISPPLSLLRWSLPVVAVVLLVYEVSANNGHHGCSLEKHVIVQARYCLDKCNAKRTHKCHQQREVCCDKMKTTAYEKCRTSGGEDGQCLPENLCDGKKKRGNHKLLMRSSWRKGSSDVCFQHKNTEYHCCPLKKRKNTLKLVPENKSNPFNDNTYPTCTTWRDSPGKCVPLALCDDIHSWGKRNYYTSYADLPLKFKCGDNGTAVCCPVPVEKEQHNLIRHELAKKFNLGECGAIDMQNRVMGGSKPALGQYPWMANLMYYIKGEKVTVCSGSLIHRRFVLTAAHCSKPGVKPIAVRLGEYDLRTSRDCTDLRCYESKEYPIQKFIHHEKYTPGGRQYDIALVQLTQEVTIIPDQISPICLPITKQWLMTKPAELILTGWGITEKNWRPSNVLLQATLIIDSNKVCHLEQMICARGSRMEGSCKGDSGGPWQQIRRYGKTFRVVLFGVNSGGACTCSVQDDAPSVMVSVGYHMDWILDNMDI